MVLYLFGNADVHLSRVPEKSSLQILGVAHFSFGQISWVPNLSKLRLWGDHWPEALYWLASLLRDSLITAPSLLLHNGGIEFKSTDP